MRFLLCAALLGCGASTVRPPPMQLRRVILYQNGIGYFERTGLLAGGTLRLQIARPELDDVLKTLTVIDRLGGSVATVDVPVAADGARTVGLDVRLGAGRAHDLLVGYAVPTPTWKAAYRLVLDDGGDEVLLQGWAMVNNTSQEDWRGVQLTLATGAPMSLALDLSTPEYVKRPDATGRLVAPTILGPVGGERAIAQDRDADGILDTTDRCPDVPEDGDGALDDDGCPDPDTDRDSIADVDDRCPAEPETYNGLDDADGCPDRGSVILSASSSITLPPVPFARGSDAIAKQADETLGALASALLGNLDVQLVELGGHASEDEAEPWGLASRRAAAVRAALIARRVAPERLEVETYGTSMPIGRSAANNRRVELVILKRAAAAPAPRPRRARPEPPRIDATSAAASTRARAAPVPIAGAVRYALSEPVSISRGASAMVSILNRRVPGRDVLLFRPDGNAPGSDRHPFRAVRLVNRSGFTLEPGPIAIFGRGTFVGDSLVERIGVDETAWVPYALDGGTQVTVVHRDDEKPARLVSIQRGIVTVENAGLHTTMYTVAAGRDAGRAIHLRHPRAPGFTARELPPGTIDQGDAYLVPLPLAPGKTSTLAIEERQPRRRTIALVSAGPLELAAYVEGAPSEVAGRLRAAIEARRELAGLEEQLAGLRGRVGELADRGHELRESLRALEKVAGAADLRRKLLDNLARATADSDAVARALGEKTAAIAAARARLADLIRELTLDEAL